MRHSYVPPCLPDADITSLDLLLEKYTTRKKLRVFCCYFPQNTQQSNSQATFFEYLSDLVIKFPNDKFIVLGDFNVKDATWLHVPGGHITIVNTSYNNLVNQLFAFMTFTGFKQYNNIYNNNNRLLDLVLSNTVCVVNRTKPLALPEDGHHPSLVVKVESEKNNKYLRAPTRVVRCYHNADYNAVNDELSKIDWVEELSSEDITCAVGKFYFILNHIIDRIVPTKLVHENDKFPSWYSRSLIKLIKKKLKAHKKWKIYGRSSDYDRFSELRRETKRLEAECYDLFINKAENNIYSNSKKFWAFVKSKRSSNCIPDCMYYDDDTGSDGQMIANMFNTFFSSVFTADSNTRFSHDNLPLRYTQTFVVYHQYGKCL
ncbi:uncharacterized protein LOC126968180 [Leptidea sinapis]|uniref:uncharacterized protein LOC126968180 n=1 Tax=Leptidea sinapis TaxID=189913 RepID=UPI0021C3DAA0|nr:uncharacterized protein LOC126968180 [Leptidea sinapis]